MDISSPRIEEHMHFICPECGLELPTQIIWRKHLNSYHEYNKKTVDVFNFKEINERYHECNECHKWVANGNQSITTLQYHRISHLPFNLTFKCRYCVKSFARKRALCEHLVEVHNHLLNTNINVPRRVETLWPSLDSNVPKSHVGNLDEYIMSDLVKGKKDQGDLIQKALLDSLIDLENETFAELNKNGSDNDVNEFALNQSLNDLEAILKGDFDSHNVLTQEYKSTQHEYGMNYDASADPVDIEDNELLEQICADIFEEVVETAEVETMEQKMESAINYKTNVSSISSSTDSSAVETNNTNVEPNGEKIISIEIDTVNESERRNMYSSPKRKRLKLELPPIHSLETDTRIKRLLETYIIYLCPECGREFKTQSEWRSHVFKVHDLTTTMHAKYQALKNGKSHICLDCREILHQARTQDLLRHRFTHMPFQSYLKCTFCAKTKSSKPKIMQHLQDFHSSTLPIKWTEKKPPAHLICSFCDKSFQTRARLQEHHRNCYGRKTESKMKISTDSTITNNLNLITHLKKMRARMRNIRSADNESTTPINNNNYSVMSRYKL